MNTTSADPLKVFVEVPETVSAGGIAYTGKLEDAAKQAIGRLVELPEQAYTHLGTTAGKIAEAILQALRESVTERGGQVRVRFGLTFTGSLDIKVVDASAKSAIAVDVKWPIDLPKPKRKSSTL